MAAERATVTSFSPNALVSFRTFSIWRNLPTYNIVIGMIVAIGTFGYGFGFGVFITSIGQPGFYADMKLDRKQTGWIPWPNASKRKV